MRTAARRAVAASRAAARAVPAVGAGAISGRRDACSRARPSRSRRWRALRRRAPRSRRSEAPRAGRGSRRVAAGLRAERPHVGLVGVEQQLVAPSTSPACCACVQRGRRRAAPSRRTPAGSRTLSTIASTFASTLCDWSIVSRGSDRHCRRARRRSEQLERVDRADDQVVVGVFAVVEVKATEPIRSASIATICSTLMPCA